MNRGHATARRGRGVLAIFGIPVLLAIVSLAGLVFGLLGDDGYDIASGVAVAVPVAVILWALIRARRPA